MLVPSTRKTHTRTETMAELSASQAEWFAVEARKITDNISNVVVGKPETVQLVTMALLAEGHVLIEDVPGTGKTTLARSVAESIDGVWKRIQFTPDLLPSDVTGAHLYHPAKSSFEFHPGAVFANVVLADEINRASPKTQSALLEVMEERQHTADGQTLQMPRPFVVIATQNPIEQDGTYRLPEAQLDRFLIKTNIGSLRSDDEIRVLAGESATSQTLQRVMTASDVSNLISVAERVNVAPSLLSYVVQLAERTRAHPELRLGVSTRGTLALVRASRVLAAMNGQTYVLPDHVKQLVRPVFAHRMLLTADAEFNRKTPEEILEDIVGSVKAPVAERV